MISVLELFQCGNPSKCICFAMHTPNFLGNQMTCSWWAILLIHKHHILASLSPWRNQIPTYPVPEDRWAGLFMKHSIRIEIFYVKLKCMT